MIHIANRVKLFKFIQFLRLAENINIRRRGQNASGKTRQWAGNQGC